MATIHMWSNIQGDLAVAPTIYEELVHAEDGEVWGISGTC
jgi:hypothetical protein